MKKLVLVFGILLGVMALSIGKVMAQGKAEDKVFFKNDQGQWVEYTGSNIVKTEENNKTVLDISDPTMRIITAPPIGVGDRKQPCGENQAGVICGLRTIREEGGKIRIICDHSDDSHICISGIIHPGGVGGPHE